MTVLTFIYLFIGCRYKMVLDTDNGDYGGHRRLDSSVEYHTFPEPWDNRQNHMLVHFDVYFIVLNLPHMTLRVLSQNRMELI